MIAGLALSLTLAAGHRHPVFRFADPRIVEASSLVVRGGLFTTANDSGDVGRVFTLDRHGHTVGVTAWPQTAVDDEALAPLPHGRVLVGDIGDNDAVRSSVTLRVVPVGRGDRTVARPTSYELVYPHGPADAETLMVQPGTGRIVVATKGLFGGQLLEAPRHLSRHHANRMRVIGSVLAVATDGAFFPDGRHFVVRNYLEATVYSFPGLRTVGTFALPAQPQGEGIAVDPAGHVHVDSEGVHTAVLRARLPHAIKTQVLPVPAAPPRPEASSAAPGAPGRHDHGASSGWPYPWLGGGVALLAVVALGGAVVRRRRGDPPIG